MPTNFTFSTSYSPIPHVSGVASPTTAPAGLSGQDLNMSDSSYHELTPSVGTSVHQRRVAVEDVMTEERPDVPSHARLHAHNEEGSQRFHRQPSKTNTNRLANDDNDDDDNEGTLQSTISQSRGLSLQAPALVSIQMFRFVDMTKIFFGALVLSLLLFPCAVAQPRISSVSIDYRESLVCCIVHL